MLNFPIINHVVIETLFISALMWIIAPRQSLRNYKMMLVAMALTFLFLLIVPLTNVLGVLCYAGVLMLLRHYCFAQPRQLAVRQVVLIFILKYFIAYFTAFIALLGGGVVLTVAQLNLSVDAAHVGWGLLFSLAVIVLYRRLVNRLLSAGHADFFTLKPIVVSTLGFAFVSFSLLNLLYRFYWFNSAAIAAIDGLPIVLILSVLAFVASLCQIALLAARRWLQRSA